MKNLHKLLIVFISVGIIASGAMAQSADLAPKAKLADKTTIKKEFNEDQLKQLAQAGISEQNLATNEGLTKAYELLKKNANQAMNSTTRISTFNSKPIKNSKDLVTVTIGIESNISGDFDTDITPFGTYYEDGQNQFLFDATELAIAGLGAGDITEIGWEVVVADPTPMAGFNIEVKHTTATTVTAFETGFTNVYSGSYTAVAGWNMFTFTTPFTYDGVSNLLVKVCFDNGDYTTNSSVYYSNTINPMNGWAYNDGTAGCSDPYEGSIIERPNTRITGEENLAAPPGYPFDEVPPHLSFDVPVDGDLTWMFGNNTDTYDLWFGLEGNMQLVVDDDPVSSPDGLYSYTGLNYASVYEWQVVGTNANGTTSSLVWSFVTECAVVSPPYLEEYSIWPPVCWDMTGGTYDWIQYNVGGVVCAEASFWGQTSGNNDYMTTGEIDISGGNYGLEFYWSHLYSPTYPDDALEVLVSDDDGATWTQVWYLEGTDFNSNDGAGNTTPGTFVSSEIIPLSPFSGTIKVRFIGHSGYGPDCFVDNVNIFEVAYGNLDGTVTDGSATPIEDAMITIGSLSTMTGSDGTYSITGVLVGDYTVYCSATGYNPAMADVTIVVDETFTQDFTLTAPQIVVDPLSIEITLEPNEMADEMVDISNTGDGTLDWSAATVIEDNSKEPWDLQFSFDVEAATGALGNAGAECDGQYYYTTRWASNLLHKYDLDGNLIEEFSIPGVSGLRDLAFDGTYMYGGAAGATIYEMDFTSQTLVSSISNSGIARSIAYDVDNDAFWISDFGSNVWQISKTGATLNTIPNANLGLAGMYGSAYDNTTGTPYLWMFDQGSGAGTPQYIHQIDLTTLMPTGFTFDVLPDLGPNAQAIAGGLFMVDNIYPGLWSLGGLLQGTPDVFFMFEFAPAGPLWLTIDPTSGTLDPGTNEQMTVHFDATDLLPGVYEATINFSSDPDVGNPSIDVTMTVEGLIPAINLEIDYMCTDIELTWEMPTGGLPDSWNIYRDGNLIGNATEMMYTDEMIDPDVEYGYYIKAVYLGEESMPTATVMMTVPLPDDMEATGLTATADIPDENDVTLDWDAPDCCVAPDGYNVYRDDVMINTSLVTELTFVDPDLEPGFLYTYHVVAVYYFGESEASDPAFTLITGVNPFDAKSFRIQPNPATDYISVQSEYMIESYELLNNIGQLVKTENLNTSITNIDVSQFESGIYYLKLKTTEGISLNKIVIGK
ncbi:MAG: carboxypeptidase regulatory-like domain-containing protein [Bacteroidales bacterium]